MRRLSVLRARVEPFDKLSATFKDMQELDAMLEDTPDEQTAGELDRMAEAFLRDLDDYEITTLLSGEHDADNAIVDIGAGAGGTEACDWAQMLFRMLARWAERHAFELEVLSLSPGDVTGYRGITFAVRGQFAYGRLRSEHGVHRLVRISPFDAAGRRHTSFAIVDVVPEVSESEIDIAPEDLKIETYRAGGAGGQHVNKTESAVRITHLPTGLVVTCQNERSQHKNRATAMAILASRVAELERTKSDERMRQLRGDATPAEWGHQIRSYVLQPYTIVKDLRTNHETGNVQAVLDGDIDAFIESFLRLPAER
jgi:peptide chain release factor 2